MNNNDGKMSLDDLYIVKDTSRQSNVQRTPVYDSIEELNKAQSSNSANAPIKRRTIPAEHSPSGELKKVDIYDVAPHRKVEAPPTIEDMHYDMIDKALERTKVEMSEIQSELMDRVEDSYLENINNNENNVNVTRNDEYDVNAEYGDDMSDLLDEEEDEYIPAPRQAKSQPEVPISEPEEEDVEEETPVDNTPKLVNNTAEDVPSTPKKVIFTNADEDVRSDSDELDEDIKNELGVDSLDEEDVDEDDTIVTPEERREMLEVSRKKLREEVKAKIIPITNKVDLTKFKIRKKPVSITSLMRDELKVADWGLFSAGKSVTCKAIKALDIAKLDTSDTTSSTRFTKMRTAFHILYDSIVDENKPSFEDWLKGLTYSDADHIYFAIFKATFDGSCFFNYTCPNPKCNNAFIEDKNFDDLVVYKDDETKEKAQRIVRSGKSDDGSYDTDLIQISDEYCISTRLPSAYHVIFNTASLSDQFIEKYSDVIDIISFIDEIYYIDQQSNELIPVNTKPVKNDRLKTVTNRIRIYNAILNKLTTDQYSALNGMISARYADVDGVSYQLPATTCPKCGATIPAVDYTAEQLLFMRHRLGLFANT